MLGRILLLVLIAWGAWSYFTGRPIEPGPGVHAPQPPLQEPLKDPAPSFEGYRITPLARLGDHDFWTDQEETAEVQRRCGWLFLDNDHSIINHNGRAILVTGLTHIYNRRMADSALGAFLSLAPDADLKVLIVHQPAETVVRQAAARGYHLLLAGHTHGGQIVFHPFGIPLTPSQHEYEVLYGNIHG